MAKGVLIDLTRCIGCRGCQAACKEWNERSVKPTVMSGTYTNPAALSSECFTHIRFVEQEKDGRPVWSFVKKQCLHCLEPACEAACLVGAMKKTPDGPVIYDASKCIGCRYCMLACPVGIPRYNWESPLPLIQKCDMCFDRLAEGKQCACVEACPHGALSIGKRDEQISKAHALIKANPGKYIDHVYGETELGGTCVLYIGDTNLEKVLRLDKVVGDTSIPDITWPVISKTPIIGGTVLLGLIGTYVLLERKNKIAAEQAAKEAPALENQESESEKDETNE